MSKQIRFRFHGNIFSQVLDCVCTARWSSGQISNGCGVDWRPNHLKCTNLIRFRTPGVYSLRWKIKKKFSHSTLLKQWLLEEDFANVSSSPRRCSIFTTRSPARPFVCVPLVKTESKPTLNHPPEVPISVKRTEGASAR